MTERSNKNKKIIIIICKRIVFPHTSAGFTDSSKEGSFIFSTKYSIFDMRRNKRTFDKECAVKEVHRG